MGTWHFGQRRKVGARNIRTAVEEQLPVSVPAIVDVDTWNAAQIRVIDNAQESKRNRKHEYLLAGHVRCGLCEARASGKPVNRETKQYHYYVCNARVFKNSYRHTCEGSYYRGEPIDKVVWDWLADILTNPEMLQTGLRAQQENRAEVQAPLQHQMSHLAEQIDALQVQRERLLDLYLNGKIPMTAWEERNNDLQERLHTLAQERVRIDGQALI
jgi:site-specific DNA recombinase